MAALVAIVLGMVASSAVLAADWSVVQEKLLAQVDDARLGFFDRLAKRNAVQSAIRELQKAYGDIDVPVDLVVEAVRLSARGTSSDEFRQLVTGLVRAMAEGLDPETVKTLIEAATKGRLAGPDLARIAFGLDKVSRLHDREQLERTAEIVLQVLDDAEAVRALGQAFTMQKVSGEEISNLVEELLAEGVRGKELAEAVVDKATEAVETARKASAEMGTGESSGPGQWEQPASGGGSEPGTPTGPHDKGDQGSTGGVEQGTGSGSPSGGGSW
ncbi:MAG: hypothetical protein AB1609_13040 [Bacillota bacterium]